MGKVKFTTDYQQILRQIEELDTIEYAKTRNFTDGAVSRLSPYLSRGVISLKQILQAIIDKGTSFEAAEKFLQELAWREYYQRIWQEKKELIWEDLSKPQPDVVSNDMITSIIEAETGINAIDNGIQELYQSGYMHNHIRMYVASVTCNIGKIYWKQPSKWLYYYLLDGDIASNNASWQWVSAAFSGKKYYCNQENINKYTSSYQENTFLDKSYEELPLMEIPQVLKERTTIPSKTVLPKTDIPNIDQSKPTIIYNSYNLDPVWRKSDDANRILLLEPSHFTKYPVSEQVIDFIISLSENIPGIQIFAGEFSEIESLYKTSTLQSDKIFISKAHPAFLHYTGIKDSYEWMFPEVTGAYPSFFKYWKLCRSFLVKSMNHSNRNT
ncbi:FAD-binding domain-containing protein [Pedobacter sp. Leaf170]|uniref:FAD-binding domain-containing protein n=1 Tax=Pedobacter sp. Leaf170 TaxID=2876558 RepID=UPI001E2E6C9C|nr:FAD-binding domain-containing protein [Pedobacter sp. Leaf170]